MKTLDHVSGGLAVLAGLVLVGLIGLTFADVVLRYVFAAPILGTKDLLEMGMVTVVALAFPFTWRIGGHIVVDLIPEYGIGGVEPQPRRRGARDRIPRSSPSSPGAPGCARTTRRCSTKRPT